MATERIEFLCPSGHQLHGPITLAGRAGQCPHCGMRFRIPSIEELTAAANGEEYVEEVEEEQLDTGSGDEAPTGFLDTGPTTEAYYTHTMVEQAQAHPAEQLAEELPEEDFEEAGEDADVYEEEAFEEVVEEYVEEYIEEAAAEPGDFGFFSPTDDEGLAEGLADADRAPNAATAGGAHPMAELFAELWRHKGAGAVVELHLGGNETLHVEQYSPAHSQRSLGVFAVPDGEGAFTVTAIAWDLINRISVRGVKELPDGFLG